MPARTVVIGLDGVDRRYLDAFAADLPTVSALRDRGVEASLASTHPPWTASAWPSAYTGVPPSDHGVYGFFSYPDHDPAGARLVDRSDVDAPAVWDYCSAAVVPVAVLNVPVTHPADAVEGALVPGYFAPPGAPGHPPGIRDRIADDYRIYPAGGPDQRDSTDDGSTPDAQAFVDHVDSRATAAVELLETVDWRLAFLQVQATDTAAHDLADDAALRRVYAAADRFVGRVLDAVPDGTGILVCSDHGMGPADGHEVFVNELLRDRGLLVGTGDPARRSLGPGTDPGVGQLVGAATARTTRAFLDRAGLTGRRVPGPVKRLGEAALGRAAVEGVDWGRSRAFCRVGSEMGVRINRAGREPGGVVPDSAYDRVRSAVIDALSDLRTPDGDPAFATVERYEAHAGVEPSGDAPDVVFRPAPGNAASAKLVGRRLAPARGRDHRPTGAFVAADGPFDGVAPVDPLSITQVAPIAMASLGLGVPERMRGTVPPGWFPAADRRPYEVAPAEDRGEASAAVRDRLDDLGYL